jgi:hypothetical protein
MPASEAPDVSWDLAGFTSMFDLPSVDNFPADSSDIAGIVVASGSERKATD